MLSAQSTESTSSKEDDSPVERELQEAERERLARADNKPAAAEAL